LEEFGNGSAELRKRKKSLFPIYSLNNPGKKHFHTEGEIKTKSL